jgi:trimethylamine:corrinoid methyltransferase-like protein
MTAAASSGGDAQFALTAEEVESVALTEEDLELVEEELLEDVEAEELEAASKSLLNRILAFIKQIVLKILKNTGAAAKLRDAVKKGPEATCRLICPLVCKVFPFFLRPICARLCPIACRRLFPWIKKAAGV